MNNYCVITTIHQPTHAVKDLHDKFGEKLIVVGDQKTPEGWEYKNVWFLPAFKNSFPVNHYARKNVGYLEAIAKKADSIYSTDDDNIPNENWGIRAQVRKAYQSKNEGWFNVYKMFSDVVIWPRGFSLKHLFNPINFGSEEIVTSSIQQGLSDVEPDVDAIWRLTRGINRKYNFQKGGSIYLQPNTWCPFNTQSTWFFPKAYPLMYLPVYCNMRVTDIWSSFIAQRCLWEIGEGVTFHSPSEVFQDRNEHDLMKDFADEVPGYLNNDRIVEILGGLTLKQGDEFVCENLLTCYEALIEEHILPLQEWHSVKAWIKDYENIVGNI